MRPMGTMTTRFLLLAFLAAIGSGLWGGAPALHAEDAPAAPVAAPKAPAKAPPKVTGRFETVEGHRILTLWGTPRERGFAQGYLLAEHILAGFTHDFESILKPFLPQYEMLIKTMVVPNFKFSPRELQEMEGLFAGLVARLPREKLRIAALNRDLELVDIKAINTFGDWYGLGCSSLAVWGELSADGQPLVGRNFDFPAYDLVLRHQYVVVRAPDGEARGQVGVSYPGCIGTLTGMNADGVFVAIHDVPIRPGIEKALRANVPRLLAVRRLLEQVAGSEACKQASALVRTWPTLYGNNLMVVAPRVKDGVPCAAVLEYDCRLDLDGGCTLRVNDGVEGRKEGDPPIACLACTNHHRARDEPPNYKELKPRWRYPELSCIGGEERPDKPLGVADMFRWMGKTAYPKHGKPQQRAVALKGPGRHHGTIHQAVGQTGKRMLHLKLGVVGKHIRDVTPRRYDVRALLSPLTPTPK